MAYRKVAAKMAERTKFLVMLPAETQTQILHRRDMPELKFAKSFGYMIFEGNRHEKRKFIQRLKELATNCGWHNVKIKSPKISCLPDAILKELLVSQLREGGQ